MKNLIYPLCILSLLWACAPKQTDAPTEKPSIAPTYELKLGAEVKTYETARDTSLRLAELPVSQFVDFGQPVETQACVFVDPTHSFQTVLGIGGAITDASAEVFAKLSVANQEKLLTAYYDPQAGVGYSLVRTNIQSCDFSSGSYSYVAENDSNLNTFDIAHDKQFRIPLLKKAIDKAYGKITLYASPWSPPAWMKTNNDVLLGGKLLPKYYQNWANFYVKFIQAYKNEGLDVWGVTVQNEPMAVQSWESCIYTAEEERDFVGKYLGPTFHNSGMADKKIIIWDHNRDLIYQRASTVLNDTVASKYVWGVGFHWYVNNVFENIAKVQEAFPQTNLIFTEGCAERYDQARIGDWNWGERYGESMIHDFNHGAVGWTDWNILLDNQGGPNHVGNFCYAPVHTDAKGELVFMNSYYYIGHFSKFIRPGAKRISCATNRDDLLATAFHNPDGSVAVVVMNQSDKNYTYALWVAGKAVQVNSRAHSIITNVF